MSGLEINRRSLLKGIAAGVAALLPWGLRAQPAPDRRFLIVITATGGASIIDAMLAIRASESNQADVLNTFADAQVQTIDGTPFRAIDLNIPAIGPLPYTGMTNQSDFVRDTRKT